MAHFLLMSLVYASISIVYLYLYLGTPAAKN